MDFQDKKVLVVGTGISGIGAAGLLVKMGACPVLFDSNDKLKREDILKRAGNEPSLIVLLGSVPDELKEEIGLVVVSPGVPSDSLFIDEFRQRSSLPMPAGKETWWQSPGQTERLPPLRLPDRL